MKAAWIRRAAALPARQLHLVGAGILLIAAAALWLYALRAPLTALRTVRAERAQLEAAGGNPRLLAAQLALLDSDAEALARRLGSGPVRPAAQMLVGLVGDIGALAQAHGVELHAATPAPEEQALAFVQVGFDAEVSGSYAALLAWINAVEQSRPDLAVAGFEMRAAKTPGQVDMKIRIAAYRRQERSK